MTQRVTETVSDKHLIATTLAQADLAIFAARLVGGRKQILELSTLDAVQSGALRRSAQKLFAGRGLRTRVVSVKPSAIKRARSLEQLVALTGRGDLVFDRTRALSRSEAVLDLTARIRAELGAAVGAVFFHGDRRTLFVTLAGSHSADAVSDILARIDPIASAWHQAQSANGFELAIRVGFSAPSGLDLIAVDRETVRTVFLRLLRRPMQSRLGKVVLGTLLGASITAPALAAGPAVDAPNVTVMTRAGVVKDKVNFEHLWSGVGIKAAMPLGEQFGAQIDLGVGTDMYYGAAAHLFARDPDMGLIGVMGSFESRYGISMTRLGVEGELYVNENLTLSALAGLQGGGAPNGAFGRLDLRFYPDDNFMLRAGVEVQPTLSLARAGFEWQPAIDSLPGLSVFGDGSISSTGDHRLMFGLNFQIGAKDPGTLIQRHRRSDPPEAIFNEFDISAAAPAGYSGAGPV